jgi:hypothetical protein
MPALTTTTRPKPATTHNGKKRHIDLIAAP